MASKCFNHSMQSTRRLPSAAAVFPGCAGLDSGLGLQAGKRLAMRCPLIDLSYQPFSFSIYNYFLFLSYMVKAKKRTTGCPVVPKLH